jgi:hypothetical protein
MLTLALPLRHPLDLGGVAHDGGGKPRILLLVLLPSTESCLITHPLTYKCCEAAHKGDNLDRYLLVVSSWLSRDGFYDNIFAALL